MSMIYANQIERVNLYRQTDRHMNRVVMITSGRQLQRRFNISQVQNRYTDRHKMQDLNQTKRKISNCNHSHIELNLNCQMAKTDCNKTGLDQFQDC